MKQWFKHAFAVDTVDGPPTAEQRALAERLCREVVRRGLAVPAVAFLEMSLPLNYLSAQVVHFFEPMLGAFTDTAGVKRFAQFLERRDAIEWLCGRINALQAEADAAKSKT